MPKSKRPAKQGRRTGASKNQIESDIAKISYALGRLEDAKRDSVIVAETFLEAGLCRYAERVKGCCSQIYVAPKEGQASDSPDNEIAYQPWNPFYCRVRFCPICQRQRAHRNICRIVPALTQHAKERKRFLLLTLTVKNVVVQKLRSELQAIAAAWHRFMRLKELKSVCLGWVRSTEIARAKDDYAHPHIHAMLVVSGGYFRKGNAAYLPHSRFEELWKVSARLDYRPSVDIRPIKGRIIKGCQEVFKYAVKPSDLIDSPEWLGTLATQIHKIRFLALGGCLKQQIAVLDEDYKSARKAKPENTMAVPPDACRFQYCQQRKVYCPSNEAAFKLVSRRAVP